MPYPRALIVLASLVASVLVCCAIVRVALWTYGADTGTFAIAIQNLPRGMYDPFEHASHFRFHWSPILATLYPLLAVTHSILALQVAQIVLVVAAVFAYYSLIVRYLGKTLALRCAIVALLYPPMIALAFSEFHELAFAPLLTFLALWSVSTRKWLWYAAFTLLLACVREDVALITALFGIVLAVKGAQRSDRAYLTAGVLTTACASIVLGLYFTVVIPKLGGWGPASFYAYPYKDGFSAVASRILTFGRLTYLLEVAVPLAFLPLRTRWIWLAVPGLAIVLFANSGEVWRMGMHYVALWLPWVLLAMAAGIAQIQQRAGKPVALRWTNAATVLCVLFLIFVNPTHAAHYLKPGYADMPAVHRVLKCVPASATLGTHDEWYAAMAFQHPDVTIGDPPDATYLLFADDYPNAEFQTRILPAVRRQVASGLVNELCRSDRVAVYRRIKQ